MTVTSTNQKVQFNGNGSTTVFAYNFKIFASSDLSVILRSAAGTETVQQLTTNYTVSGVGEASGGNVTMGTAPPSGTTLTILRVQPNLQGLDLVPNDPFPAGSMEDALDKLTFMVQTHDEEIGRSIKASRTNVISSTEFSTSATDRANKVLAFDESGNLDISQEIGIYRGNWAASTTYAVRDLVKDTSTNNVFMCLTAHTSSGSQPLTTNTDSAKWAVLVDVGNPAGNVAIGGNLNVTGSTDVAALEFNSLSGTGSVSVTDIADEDNMSSNSATKLATQQSIKSYVDAQVGTVDTLSEVLALGNTTGGTDVSVSTDDKVQFRDTAIYINSSADGQLDIVADTEIQIAATTIDINGAVALNGAITGATDISLSGTVDGRDVATDGTKLDNIEASADVTDATNVTAAGALMDSEVTNLSEVKAFAASDYATAAQGTLATNAMPKAGGAFTGAVTTNSTFDGVDIATRDGVLTSTTTTANAALPKAGGTMTGALKTLTLQETYVANGTGATTTLDLSTGTSFSVTLSENTTFAFNSPPSSGTAFSFTLFITQPASAKTIAWPASVDWAGGSAPAAPGNSEVNGYGFFTRDGGTTYYGFLGGAALG